MKTSRKRRAYLLSAPKVKRTHCYIQGPIEYEIFCPICGGRNVTWSEFEKHVWCFDCEEDVFIPLNDAGVFSGPIPIEISQMMGLRFDRFNLNTGQLVKFDTPEWENTWVRTPELIAYDESFSA
jgi:hypothetical protein